MEGGTKEEEAKTPDGEVEKGREEEALMRVGRKESEEEEEDEEEEKYFVASNAKCPPGGCRCGFTPFHAARCDLDFRVSGACSTLFRCADRRWEASIMSSAAGTCSRFCPHAFFFSSHAAFNLATSGRVVTVVGTSRR